MEDRTTLLTLGCGACQLVTGSCCLMVKPRGFCGGSVRWLCRAVAGQHRRDSARCSSCFFLGMKANVELGLECELRTPARTPTSRLLLKVEPGGVDTRGSAIAPWCHRPEPHAQPWGRSMTSLQALDSGRWAPHAAGSFQSLAPVGLQSPPPHILHTPAAASVTKNLSCRHKNQETVSHAGGLEHRVWGRKRKNPAGW